MMTATEIQSYLKEIESKVKIAETYSNVEVPKDIDPLVYEIAMAYKDLPFDEVKE